MKSAAHLPKASPLNSGSVVIINDTVIGAGIFSTPDCHLSGAVVLLVDELILYRFNYTCRSGLMIHQANLNCRWFRFDCNAKDLLTETGTIVNGISIAAQ